MFLLFTLYSEVLQLRSSRYLSYLCSLDLCASRTALRLNSP